MKTFSTPVSLFTALFLVIFLLANSSGPAASNRRGYTGAPSAGGGTEGNCSQCHSGGNFGTPVAKLLFDNDTISTYEPGRTYSVTIIAGGAPDAAGYGYQTQVLDATSAAAGTLAEPDAGSRITPLDNGRVYAEHRRRNADSTFSFSWTAPDAGTGTVNFYAMVNAVNGNGGTSGDNGGDDPTILTLQENASTSTRELLKLEGKLYPNPTTGPTTLRFTSPVSGDFQLEVFSIFGRNMSSSQVRIGKGANQIPVTTEKLTGGTYLLRLSNGNYGVTERLVVR